MKKIYKLILLSLFTYSTLFLSFTTHAIQIPDGIKCELNGVCTVPVGTTFLYFPVNIDTGTSYTCLLLANETKPVSIDVFSDRNFIFETQSLTAHKDHRLVKVEIRGKFNGSNCGAIKIRETGLEHALGYIACGQKK